MDLESHSRTDARLRTLSQLFVAGKGFFVIAESFEKKKRKKHHPVSCFSDVYNVSVGSWIAASLMQQFVNITLSLSQRFMSE